jgi:hypothetical protein
MLKEELLERENKTNIQTLNNTLFGFKLNQLKLLELVLKNVIPLTNAC